jgi:hypothetical protein
VNSESQDALKVAFPQHPPHTVLQVALKTLHNRINAVIDRAEKGKQIPRCSGDRLEPWKARSELPFLQHNCGIALTYNQLRLAIGHHYQMWCIKFLVINKTSNRGVIQSVEAVSSTQAVDERSLSPQAPTQLADLARKKEDPSKEPLSTASSNKRLRQ